MKKFNELLLLIASVSLLVLLSPTTALAAWWNPMTWFTSNGIESSQRASDVSTTTSVTSAPSVRTVTINNPELQKKIDELNQKLSDESEQLIQATNRYNDLLVEYNKTIKGDAVFNSVMQNLIADIVSKCKSQPPVYIPQPYISPVQPFPSFTCTSDNIGGSTYTYCR